VPATQRQKLGLEHGQRVRLDCAPSEWHLADGYDDLELVPADSDPGTADLTIAFVPGAADLQVRLAALVAGIRPDAVLWLLWPRRAGGHTSDLTDQVVRTIVLPTGLVDNKVAAVDDDWSGLRFVWRRSRR